MHFLFRRVLFYISRCHSSRFLLLRHIDTLEDDRPLIYEKLKKTDKMYGKVSIDQLVAVWTRQTSGVRVRFVKYAELYAGGEFGFYHVAPLFLSQA